MKLRIKRDQHKIWIICLAFSIIGFILGYFGPTTFAFLSKAKYKREKLEKFYKQHLNTNLIIKNYEFNNKI